jgi:oxygen-independent coproporphyrinogen-3 oxidase
MVITNIERLEGELNEVLNEFTQAENLDIEVSFEERGNTFCYAVKCDNEGEKFSYEVSFDGDIEKKRLLKRYAKLSLYKFLKNKFNVSLPWGALTGIRPTKLFYQQGADAERFLKEEMEVSQKKYDVLVDIYHAQEKYYVVDEKNTALYVGIPFCPTRCTYC